MDILVSGSLAYDRIMDFSGRFRDHIMPDKIHILNVSFLVNEVKENFGGTAGNIAFNLTLLGESPRVLAVIGDDFDKYEKWFNGEKVDISYVKKIKGFFTAGAYITTDQEDNQIAGFYPGPLDDDYPKIAEELLEKIGAKNILAIISPEYKNRMMAYARIYKKYGVSYIFDPGQQITSLSGEELLEAICGAKILIGNDYEIATVMEKITILGHLPDSLSNKFLLRHSEPPPFAKGGGEESRGARNGRCNAHFAAGSFAPQSGTQDDAMVLKQLLKKGTEKSLASMVEILVITKGAQGSGIYNKGEKIVIPPAKPLNVIDPTGAGDAYRAGFIKGLIEGWDLEKVGRFAGLVACYAVEKYGTQNHQFTWEELVLRYQENFGEF